MFDFKSSTDFWFFEENFWGKSNLVRFNRSLTETVDLITPNKSTVKTKNSIQREAKPGRRKSTPTPAPIQSTGEEKKRRWGNFIFARDWIFNCQMRFFWLFVSYFLHGPSLLFVVVRCCSLLFAVVRCCSLLLAVARCCSLLLAVFLLFSLLFAVVRCCSLLFAVVAVVRCFSLFFATFHRSWHLFLSILWLVVGNRQGECVRSP